MNNLQNNLVRQFSSQANKQNFKIAFFGLGNMGGFMARNLVNNGHEVFGFDVTQEAIDKCKPYNLNFDLKQDEALSKADFIVTAFPNSQIVENFYVKNKNFEKVRSDAVMLDVTTINPFAAKEFTNLAKVQNKTYLDCPMSGGVVGADKASLTFMVGSENEELFEQVKPVLSCMGKNIFNCKISGGGQIAKACNNMALAIQMRSVAEALNLGSKLGMDPKVLSSIMSTASSRCWSVDTYNPVPGFIGNLPADRDYENGFGCELVLKDLKIAQAIAEQSGANIEAGLLSLSNYEQLCADGFGKKDLGYIYKVIQEQNNK